MQSKDPRWGVGAMRPTVEHDLVVATITAGPVGFGDLINGTNATLLRKALRQDGTILKPASAALRVDRYWKPAPDGGAEIWAAVTGPAGSGGGGVGTATPANNGGANSVGGGGRTETAVDNRANSMAGLGEEETAGDDVVWWWSVLSTDVDGTALNAAPLMTHELWPAPAASAQFLVATIEGTQAGTTLPVPGPRCQHGAKASSCLTLWDAQTPLHVGNAGAPSAAYKNFTLFAAAPVINGGWTLVGDMTKIVRAGTLCM